MRPPRLGHPKIARIWADADRRRTRESSTPRELLIELIDNFAPAGVNKRTKSAARLGGPAPHFPFLHSPKTFLSANARGRALDIAGRVICVDRCLRLAVPFY